MADLGDVVGGLLGNTASPIKMEDDNNIDNQIKD